MTAAARPLRADAARNRERVLAAARTVFAQRGLEVTLDEIAREAGLGVGTVYRRFPDREAIVEALFEERIAGEVERVRTALADPDPWQGLTDLIEGMCADLAADRGLRQVLLSSEYGLTRVAVGRAQILPLAVELVSRAEAAGALRPGFSAKDMPPLFLMIGTVADFAGESAPDLWRRYLQMFLDGIRAVPGQSPLEPGALTESALATSMDRWRPDRR